MRRWSKVLLASLGALVLGCASCVPGICGCALSIFPSNWEANIDLSAMLLDLLGALGIVVSLIAMVVIKLRSGTRPT